MRFTDTGAHALLHILPIDRLQPGGFPNRELRSLIARILGPPPDITPSQTTYDLRRLRSTASSNASPAAAATRSPPPACARQCCSPAPTTDLLRAGLAELTVPTPPAPPGCATRPASTRPRSTTWPGKPTSRPDTHHHPAGRKSTLNPCITIDDGAVPSQPSNP